MRQTKHQFKYAVCRLKKAKDKIETDILVNLEIICGTLQMSVICEIDSLAPQIVKMSWLILSVPMKKHGGYHYC